MRARIDYDIRAMAARITKWQHPYAADWDVAALSRCLGIRILDGDFIIGHVWYHWVNHWAGELELHIVVDPDFRGRWYTRQTRKDLIDLARLCDARVLCTPLPRDDALGPSLTRWGFEWQNTLLRWTLPIPQPLK